MGAAFVLMEPKAVAVNPGNEASVNVTIRNVGPSVDVLRLEALGDSAGWVDIQPRELHLMPGTDGTATVTFKPPRDSSVWAGRMPFAVKATSQHEGVSAVEEGQVDVLPFVAVTVELIPRTARGRRRAKVELAVDNRGNAQVDLKAAGIDTEGQMTVEVGNPELHCDPGGVVFTPVTVKPVKPFWRGNPKTSPFKVQLTDTANNVLDVDGTMVQDPLLPKWFFKALIGLLVALIALAILWLTLLKPAVESAARAKAAEEVEEQIAEATADLPAAAEAAAKKAVEAAVAGGGGPVPTAEEVAKLAEEAAQETINDAVQQGAVLRPEDAIDFRLAPDSTTGAPAVRDLTGKQFSLTDIVLQNPKGDSGILKITRGGEVILEVGLDNFRDLDYHYVTPVLFDEQNLAVEVTCENPPGTACTPAVSFGGFEVKKK